MVDFDIHVDGEQLSPDFERRLEELGFWRSDFAHLDTEDDGFEPNHHFTSKTDASSEFRRIWTALQNCLNASRDALVGYIEGEHVPLDRAISFKPFDPSVRRPFRLELTSLAPGTFRESEIHVTLLKEESDQRVRQSLRQMGFFSGFIYKPGGLAQVLTIQGSREQISQLLPLTIAYLESAGGAVDCNIKEERIAKWWVSDPNLTLPPVIHHISRA